MVKLECKKNLLQAKLLATKLAGDEKAFHEGLPGPLQMVLQGENLLVWKALLERYEYDDMAVASFTGRSGVFIGLEVKGCCEPSASV